MRFFRGWAVVAALSLTAFAAAAAPPPLSAQEGVLSGVIVDASSSVPLAQVSVTLEGRGRSAITDLEGRFALPVRGSGVIVLIIERLGYETRVLEVAREALGQELAISLQPVGIEVAGVTVAAERSRQDALLREPAAIARLSAEDIQRRRGQTLGHTIEEIPGVAIIQYGPSIAKPVVRGLHSQRIVVSNGGVRQEGQQWGGEHAPEIDIFGAREIEVLRGPGAVVYGPDALGGVVQIEPGALPVDAGWGGEVVGNAFANNRQGAGSIMLENGGVRLPFVGRTALQFRVSSRRAGDSNSPDYNLQNTGFSEFNLSGGIGWQGSWGRSEILLSRYSSELGLFTGAHIGNFDDLMRAMERGRPRLPSSFSYEIRSPRQEITHDKALWRNTFFVGGDRVLEATYGFQLNRRKEFDRNGPLSSRDRPAFGLDLYTHTLDGSFGFSTPLGRTTVGVAGMRQGNLSTGQAYLIPQYRMYQGGAFAKQDLERGAFTFSGAIRYDAQFQRIFPVIGRTFLPETEETTFRDYAGSFGMTWEVLPDWFIGSSFGRAWRAPNVNERFSEGVHHGTAQYEIGDASLGPERTRNVDVSLRKAGERFSFQVNAYRNAIDDYIFLRPRDPVLTIRGAYPAFNFESVDAIVRGIEVDADLRLVSELHLFAHGSVTRGRERVSDLPLFDMPADRMRAGLRFTAPGGDRWRGFSSEVSMLLVRDQTEVPPVTVYALPTEGYQLLDASVGFDAVRLAGQEFQVSLDVRNLLNRRFRDYLSRYKLFVDDPGRDIVLRFRVPLDL
jgi:iron complex outermembrane receptor protein